MDDFLVDADLQELGQACPARLRLQGDDPGAHGMPGALHGLVEAQRVLHEAGVERPAGHVGALALYLED